MCTLIYYSFQLNPLWIPKHQLPESSNFWLKQIKYGKSGTAMSETFSTNDKSGVVGTKIKSPG